MFKYHNVGHGPGEYAYIYDFDVKDNGDIILLCNPEKLIFLNDSLNYKSSFTLDESYRRMITSGDDIFLYEDDENRIDFIDVSKNKTESIWRGKALFGLNTDDSFTKNENGSIFFYNKHNTEVYQIKDRVVEKYIELDFDKKDAIIDYLSKNPFYEIRGEDRIKYGLPSLVALNVTDDEFSFIYVYQMSFYGCIYNINTGKYIDGVIRNYPGLGPTFWGKGLIGFEESYDFDLNFYLNYEYLKGTTTEYMYEIPDSDNPIIIEAIRP